MAPEWISVEVGPIGEPMGGSELQSLTLTIIFKETLKRKMLKLPQKFVKLYGESLSNSVVLKPPFGSTWKIGLKKRKGMVWLQQGWPEFAKHFALGFGHLLFFRYKGNSQFQLSICDRSTCEIPSPSIPAHLDERDVNESKKEETEGDHDSVQIFDSSSSGEEDLPPSSPPHKRVRPSTSGQGIKATSGDKPATRRGRKPTVYTRTRSQAPTEEDKTLGSDSSDDIGIHPLGRAEETKSRYPQAKLAESNSGNRKVVLPTRKLLRKSEAFKAADKFYSIKPFFKSVVRRKYNLRLPASFVKRHIEQKPQTVRLEVGNRSWPVQFLNCNSGHFLCGGYSKFLKENSLGRDDVCIYELNIVTDALRLWLVPFLFQHYLN
ncbi:hypothetical protein TIFTF001_027058 [Ficus carica]|uniref:TF-B3 domain-containing protein n=1 Tax=Ficus carica TaxID=3494 RepID=A0AA88DMA6_FICCA|nr:hypothetical protein TIFTF001_027058 [Ficus carica]